MRKIRNTILLTMLIIMSSQISVNAHGDQSVEGHNDIFNKSGLGKYHYHHGHEAHLHPNGVCKYRETERQNTAIKQGNEDGYDDGYLGIEKEYEYLENNAYYAIYKKSYDEKYEEGKSKAEGESEIYYNKGKELGESGKNLDTSYDNKIFDKAYKSGYSVGYEVYKSKVTEEYRQQGLSDGEKYSSKISFDNLEDYMINAYENGYADGYKIYKQEIIDHGYSAAFGNGNKKPSYTEQENEWYNEGYNEGIRVLNEIIDEARQLGFDGKDESELDKFTEGREQAIKAFKEGKEERLNLEKYQNEIKLKQKREINLIKYGMVGFVIVILICIFIILKNIKKEKEYYDDDYDNVA